MSSGKLKSKIDDHIAKRLEIKGIVQGVGFRPFVYQLAKQHGLKGEVANTSSGVSVHLEGNGAQMDAFCADLAEKHPPLAHITDMSASRSTFRGCETFSILKSRKSADRSALISPDVSVCEDCLREMFDPRDRRYHYPFINCTNCGPRYTIISDMPYDRPKTAMKHFEMCPECQAEYDDPGDRRFHAQPNACGRCGPHVALYDRTGKAIQARDLVKSAAELFQARDPVKRAAELLKAGHILAIKGLGGFHLAVDAENNEAVLRLRKRKHREEKPFALMSQDISAYAQINPEEEALLLSPSRPIVLLKKKEPNPLSESISPENRHFGVMLPYTPLHYLLLTHLSPDDGSGTLVMTSGNRSNEPIAIDNADAFERISDIADDFLIHDRDIYLRSDDSIVRNWKWGTGNWKVETGNWKRGTGNGELETGKWKLETGNWKLGTGNGELESGKWKRETGNWKRRTGKWKVGTGNWEPETENLQGGKSETQFLRRSRGYVPVPVFLKEAVPEILACGAELKNTICLTKGEKAFLSQHMGDMENLAAYDFFKLTIDHMKRILDISPKIIAHDLHPDYMSTRYALDQQEIQEKIPVQHHHAHIVSCMAEHHLQGPVIGLAFDGTGYGTDGNIWGGEILLVDLSRFTRAAHLSYIPMPGSASAIREPWRMGLSYLCEVYGERFRELDLPLLKAIDEKRIRFVIEMIRKGVNAPYTSSLGRLFDGAAAIMGLRTDVSFEGQAAMGLEMRADENQEGLYDYEWISEDTRRILFHPIIQGIVDDMGKGIPLPEISGKFHNTLIRLFSELCGVIREENGLNRVVLSGGVFQNAILLTGLMKSLAEKGFQVFTNTQVPPNDGGIALGQAVVAAVRCKV